MEHESDNCCFSLDPIVHSLILPLCPGSLEKFHLQHLMTGGVCIVPEMVFLVISVDLLILVCFPVYFLVVLADGFSFCSMLQV